MPPPTAPTRAASPGPREAVCSARARPVVLVPTCHRSIGKETFHVAGTAYARAVRLAGCVPLLVPNAEADEIDALLDLADGVLLTGSPSNVHPASFGEPVLDPRLPLDPARDAWVLPMIPKVLARGLPLFALCRGLQEFNIALGGSLHQAVHAVPGFADHREPADAPLEAEYAAAHAVEVRPGGLLGRLGLAPGFRVNSLHGQGVNRLADGLRVEASAPDGVIEAFSLEGAGRAGGFALAVQWHPEWQAADNPVSMRLLGAFGDACRAFRQRRDLR